MGHKKCEIQSNNPVKFELNITWRSNKENKKLEVLSYTPIMWNAKSKLHQSITTSPNLPDGIKFQEVQMEPPHPLEPTK